MDKATGYQVLVDDNFHYMDESERRVVGNFDTLERAVEACKSIVDESLAECHEPGMTPEALLARYQMFGDDPFVRYSGQDSPPFSAWDYAAERAQDICGRH